MGGRPGHGRGRRRALDPRGRRQRPPRGVAGRGGGDAVGALLPPPVPAQGDEGRPRVPLRRGRPIRGHGAARPHHLPRLRGAGSRPPRRLEERRHALLRRAGGRGGRGARHGRLDAGVDEDPLQARDALDGEAGLRIADALPAAHLVGAGSRGGAVDGCRPVRLRVPQAALLVDAALRAGVQDQALGVRRDLYRRLPVGTARLHHPGGAVGGRRQELQLLRHRQRDGLRERRVQRGPPEGLFRLPLAPRLRERAAHPGLRPGPRGEVRAERGGGRHADRDPAALRLRGLRTGGGQAALPRRHPRPPAGGPGPRRLRPGLQAQRHRPQAGLRGARLPQGLGRGGDLRRGLG